MEISRIDNNILQCTSSIRTNNLGGLIRILINIYSATEVKRTQWLTEREKDFFIGMIINLVNDFNDPYSNEAIQIYKKYFNPKINKRNISDYLTRISNKNWIEYNKKKKKDIVVNLMFKELRKLKKGGNIMFNLDYIYETPRQSMDGNNGEKPL